jgi:hypothetical protein
MKTPSTNTIALIAMMLGTAVVTAAFAASRGDSGLRIAALTMVSTASGTLLAIASTLLTGKDLTQKEPPPGTVQVSPPATVTVDSTKPENEGD